MAWLWFVQVRLAITMVRKVQFKQFKHFYIACNDLIHMEHLNQKCFPRQDLSWSYHRLTSMQMACLSFVQVRLAITFVEKVQFKQFKRFYIHVACNELIHMEHLNQKCFPRQDLSWSYHRLTSMQMAWVWFVQVRKATTLVWKVQFKQFQHFYIACNDLIHMEHQKCFPRQDLSWLYHRLTSMQMAWLWFVQVRLATTLVWKVQF